MYKECFVGSCKNNTKNAPRKIFITVPINKTRRKRWFEAVGFTDLSRQESSRLYCCENHFNLEADAENWMYFKTAGKALLLRKDVVPHKNITASSPAPSPSTSQVTDSAKKRKESFLAHFHQPPSKVKRKLFDVGESPEVAVQPFKEWSEQLHPEESIASTSTSSQSDAASKIVHDENVSSEVSDAFILSISPSKPSASGYTTTTSKYVSCGTQVNRKVKVRSVRTNTKEIKLKSRATSPCFADAIETTGLPRDTRELFRSPRDVEITSSSSHTTDPLFTSYAPSSSGSSQAVNGGGRINSTLFLVETKSRFYLGLPQEVYFFVKNVSKYANIRDRDVLITMKKIRQDDVYERLGDDFAMSASNVQRIFTSTVPTLAGYVQELVFWPDPYSIKRTLPIPFRIRYRDVESIIDCLEVEIEKPSDALKQSLTWSEYKKCNTLKFLISSTPSGFVNFISGAYGGRISDKDILKECGYLNVLPDGAKVMADRGFKHVAAMLNDKNCELIRPPSVSEGEILTKEQVKQNKTIASLRVHIERVIRRVREFQMLGPHSCIHHSLLYLMNHIIIIVCGIVNVQGPLIR